MTDVLSYNPALLDERHQYRHEAVAEMLGSLIGDVHPRLSIPENRKTVGDNHAAALTYGMILGRDRDLPSDDLPEGAMVCDDPVANLTLVEHHLAAVVTYLNNDLGGRSRLAESSLNYEEAEPLHPHIEGYRWYRGFRGVDESGGELFVYQPWMQPWEAGGSPAPILYQRGNPSTEFVQQSAFHYGAS